MDNKPSPEPTRSLRSINQNLLPVLRELLRAKNLSRAAESLHMSQPAISAALNHLRDSLGDPLLVRVGRHMQLTPRAQQLLPSVERACEAMSQVWQSLDFDPARSQRRFVIATVDHGALLLAPPLLARLDHEAPGVGLQFIQFATAQAQRQRIGDIDLLFVSREAIAHLDQPDLHVLPLHTERLVAVAGPRHFASNSGVVRDVNSTQRPNVLFYPGLGLLEGFYGNLDPSGLAEDVGQCMLRPALRVEQFSVLPLLAALTDRVAVIPSSLVERMRPFVELEVIDANLPLPPLEVCLAWSPIHDADPAHRWLRQRIQEIPELRRDYPPS
jgi:DNA-binding transcriptional LysR family regulator